MWWAKEQRPSAGFWGVFVKSACGRDAAVRTTVLALCSMLVAVRKCKRKHASRLAIYEVQTFTRRRARAYVYYIG